MRLLRFESGSFVFVARQNETYAILSHTWSEQSGDEVVYSDIVNGTATGKPGYAKLIFCRDQAVKDGHHHFWIDTCCIDKSDPAELSAALRSMFRWYTEAAVCYVYLSDLTIHRRSVNGEQRWEEAFKTCRWFSRGWTLQELLAPVTTEFFARDGHLGSKQILCAMIAKITKIPEDAILGDFRKYSRGSRIEWSRTRTTKEPEDLWYSLAGICDVSIGARYGEGGAQARHRLVGKIIKQHGLIELSSQYVSGQSGHVKLDQQQECDERKAIMSRLQFEAMDSRRGTIKNATSKTCKWILSSPEYVAWTERQALHDHHGFFWLKGKPGAGKSVMIKFIDQHVSRVMRKIDIRLSFYFNARGEALEKTFLGMYRSLLVQLLTAIPALQCVLDNIGSVTTFDESKLWKLQDLFNEAIALIEGRTVYCFIDALDESRDGEVQSLIEYFRDVQGDALAKDVPFYVCFASRHYPIVDIPTKLVLVLEDEDQHGEDLDRYIETEIRGATAAQIARIKPKMLQKSNGIFLWIYVVVRILNEEIKNGRSYALMKRLEEIPPDLMALFNSVLNRDGDGLDLTTMCLRWILYAMRPLKIQEFYFAMMAGIDSDASLEWVPDQPPETQMHAFLLSSSKGLAELTRGGRPTVQFIHESVRDFLLMEKSAERLNIGQGSFAAQSHEFLKECCLRGMQDGGACEAIITPGVEDNVPLTFAHFWKPSQRKAERDAMMNRFPFLEYAVTFLLSHSNEAAVEISQEEFLLQFRLSRWVRQANFFQKHAVNLYEMPYDVAYILAERDLSNLLKIIASRGFDLDCENQSQRNATPLFAAIANKSSNAARVILSQIDEENADAVVNELIVSGYQTRPAYDRSSVKDEWTWALKHGYDRFARSLLKDFKTFPLGPQAQHLMDAVDAGRLMIVQLLLDSGVDANAIGFSDESFAALPVLHAACRGGHVDIVKLLIEKGVDIEAKFYMEYGLKTALREAIMHGHLEIVELLLAEGAAWDTRLTYDGEDTIDSRMPGFGVGQVFSGRELEELRTCELFIDVALWYNCARGHLEMVKFLLSHGANINARHDEYGSPMQFAYHYGQTAVVRFLLEQGADVNTVGRTFLTVLQQASHHGDGDMVRTIIEKGAHVDLHHESTLSPSALAVWAGHTDVISLLKSHGATLRSSEYLIDRLFNRGKDRI